MITINTLSDLMIKLFLLGLNENECHKALFQDLLLYHLSTIYQAIFSLITYILLVN